MPADKNTTPLRDIAPPDFSAQDATPERVFAYLLKLREGVNEARRRATMNTLVQGPGIALTQTDNHTRVALGTVTGTLDCATLEVSLTGEE